MDNVSVSDESPYGYQPNFAANAIGSVAFTLIFVAQISLSIATREWWFLLTWSVAAFLEQLGYLARLTSHEYWYNITMYRAQMISVTIAPTFMAAGLYVQLSKLITIYGEHYSRFSRGASTVLFITSDALSMIIQGVGQAFAAQSSTTSRNRIGRWVVVGGLVFQVITLLVFAAYFAHTAYRIHSDDPENWEKCFKSNRKRKLFKIWVPAVAVSSLFLLVRSVFRAAQLAEGWQGSIVKTEWHFLVFDGLAIMLGMLSLTVIHPGIACGRISAWLFGLDTAPPTAENSPDFKSLSFSRSTAPINIKPACSACSSGIDLCSPCYLNASSFSVGIFAQH